MITSAELQKLSEEAEKRAKETRRTNYINEHVRKPATLSNFYTWLPLVILAGSWLVGFVIWPGYHSAIVIPTIIAASVMRQLIDWQQKAYKKKILKAEAEFNEFLSRENFKFRTRY